MLLLLIIGYGIMGLRIEPLPSVLCGGSGRHCMVARILLGRHHQLSGG